MKITVNAKPLEVSATTLDAALTELGLTSPALATACADVPGIFLLPSTDGRVQCCTPRRSDNAHSST